MTARKTTLVYGVAGVTEGSYGAGGNPDPANDAIRLSQEATLTVDYVHDGERSAGGTGGRPPGTGPSGAFATATLNVEARGANVAYDSGTPVVPNDLDLLLRISGHSKTHDDTPGSETVTYTPIRGDDPTAYESAALELYGRGVRWDLAGVLGAMNWTLEGAGFLVFEFPIRGLPTIPPTVEGLPAYTLDSHNPPNGVSLAVDIGGYTPEKVERVVFNSGLGIEDLVDMQDAGGHGGFYQTRRDPTLEVTMLYDPTNYDPDNIRDAGTQEAISFTLGSAQYNQFDFSFPQTQVRNVAPAGDGAAKVTVTYAVRTSDDVSSDDYTIIAK